MNSKKIIGTTTALATAFTLGNQVVNAETNSKVEITKTGENNLTIKNGTFNKISNKLIEIKNNAGKIVGYMPANVATSNDDNVHQINTNIIGENQVEIKDLKTLGKVREVAKPKKSKRKPKGKTAAGNISDFIPSSIDFATTVMQNTEIIVPVVASFGSIGTVLGYIPVIGFIAAPLGSIVLYTLLGVYAGKNISKNPKVNKAADRVARNIKSVAPFLSSL